MTAKSQGSILPALIAMMDDSWLRLAVVNIHFQGGNDEVGVDAFAHAPAHYRASKDVYGHGEVQPAFQRPVLRYVSHPQLVGATGSELAQHQVIENRMKFLRSARATAAPPVNTLQTKLTHEAFNSLTGAAHSVLEP